MDTFHNAGLLVTHCGEFYIFSYCAYAKKKLHQKLIDSAYVNTLNTLVINNASELRKEIKAFPSEHLTKCESKVEFSTSCSLCLPSSVCLFS